MTFNKLLLLALIFVLCMVFGSAALRKPHKKPRKSNQGGTSTTEKRPREAPCDNGGQCKSGKCFASRCS